MAAGRQRYVERALAPCDDGFAVWGALALLQLVIALVIDPDGMEFRFDAAKFIWLGDLYRL